MPGCRKAVLTFPVRLDLRTPPARYSAVSTTNLQAGARDLAEVYDSAAYARPDALWIARYDRTRALAGWAGIADGRWAVHQRAKQFGADFSETHGGVTLNIDADQPGRPGRHHRLRVPRSPAAAGRGAQRARPVLPGGEDAPGGGGVTVVCQAPGSGAGTTTVWDKLTDGTYVTDARVDTPSGTGYSAPVTRCRYPYQVTAGHGPTSGAAPASPPRSPASCRVVRSPGWSASGPEPGWAAPGSGTGSRTGTGSPAAMPPPGRGGPRQARAPLLTRVSPPSCPRRRHGLKLNAQS
jgi:hypothetical protein